MYRANVLQQSLLVVYTKKPGYNVEKNTMGHRHKTI